MSVPKREAPKHEAEVTAIGMQTLVEGVRPVTLADRLAVRAAEPIRPRRNPYAQQKDWLPWSVFMMPGGP